MEIIPAIDLKDGKAVRLTKGLMESAKIYSDEPWQVAKKFEEMGAKWLHIVDLNGAFAGEPKNLEQIEKILKTTNLKVELGGGIRSEETIKKYFELGVNRIILGSIAQKNPNFVKEMAKKYSNSIAVGIDAVDGFVAVEGWAEKSKIKATELAEEFKNSGVIAIIATDISRDGTLTGINADFTSSIHQFSEIDTIASGGLSSEEDLISLKNNKNIAGVIVGKAFYEGKINLAKMFNLNK
jgi:phosphoribosylformimino-5-aminoimidazole carboxamide ribotide isomerase